MIARLSPELALLFRRFLANNYDAAEEAATKAVYEVDLVLGKVSVSAQRQCPAHTFPPKDPSLSCWRGRRWCFQILEEMEAVLEGQVEVPITEEGAHKIVNAYLELPKSLQLAEESVDEGEAAKKPW